MANDTYASASIEYERKNPGNFNLYLLCTAVLFSLYDLVSTVMSVRAVGYGYEGNTFIREVIRSSGTAGFAGVKFGATLLALFTVYYVVQHKDDFGWGNAKMFYGIYIGAIASSLFAATSNLSVVYAGSSFYLLGLNSLQASMALLFTAPLCGLILDVAAARKGQQVRLSQRRGIIARSGSVLIICANYLNPFRHAGRGIGKK